MERVDYVEAPRRNVSPCSVGHGGPPSVLDFLSQVMLFEGQVALVTGAGRRIGRSVALRLAAEGARIAVHYRNSRSEGEAVAAEIVRGRGAAVSMRAELTRAAAIDGLFEQVAQRFARLAILVTNAALFSPPPLGQTQQA